MTPKSIQVARSRLRNASRALVDMRSAADFEEFADHWTVFLTSWKAVYTVLEQGAKVSPQSMQWFGGKKAIRRNDQLLQYMFEARNDEEHGLAQTVMHSNRRRAYFRSYSQRVAFRQDPYTGKIEAIDPDGGPAPEPLAEVPPGPQLQDVNARGNRVLSPPIFHLGQSIDATPLGVAEIALAYADSLVDEAESFITPLT